MLLLPLATYRAVQGYRSQAAFTAGDDTLRHSAVTLLHLQLVIGRLHGALFLLFVFSALGQTVERRWSFRSTIWKVLLACLLPFGTFYIDRTILKPLMRT